MYKGGVQISTDTGTHDLPSGSVADIIRTVHCRAYSGPLSIRDMDRGNACDCVQILPPRLLSPSRRFRIIPYRPFAGFL
jgi:hypothetical protein